jgi:hypothetical protein
VVNVTAVVVDDPTAVVDPNEQGTDAAGAGFSPSEIQRQAEADLAAMQHERR